ncbi:MAG TPA: hypothetical protein VGN74_05845 [Brevundimonas sp.]|jgi:hypothetical protein|uniref:hypothetical protein n=1 Tax=Brevundimonas sp. TaxID=1871086 RepID=UPI002E15F2B2|nr:hypothetical protein [Brevundimonas sp.]
MSLRATVLSMVVVLAAGIAGVASSRQPLTPPLAATVAELPPSPAGRSALTVARQDPLTARLRGVLSQSPGGQQTLASISASDVPVLGPPTPALLQAATFLGGERHYMLVIEQPGRIIEIYGSTQAFRAPAAAGAAGSTGLPDRPAAPEAGAAPRVPSGAPRTAVRAPGVDRPQDVQVERTEYGVDVAFSRYGAVYSVSFICTAPNGASCSEAEATGFAASLVLLGGGD